MQRMFYSLTNTRLRLVRQICTKIVEFGPLYAGGVPNLLPSSCSIVPQGGILKQMFLDLTKHPRYTQEGQALLPAGSDRIVILPAYESVDTG